MHRTSRTIRPVIAVVGSLLLTASLAGCTLVTTLAGGGRETPTPTPTKSETSTPEKTTSSPDPTNTSSATPSGESVTSDRARVEQLLADDYEDRFGSAVTVTCEGGTQIELYVGLRFNCDALETGGTTYTLQVEVTEVDASVGDVMFRYTRS